MATIQLGSNRWTFDESAVLGQPGAFGRVHPGTGSDGQDVAIKMLHAAAAAHGHRELEFARGFIGRSVQHVVPILDCGQDEASGRVCIVMARADNNLRDHLQATTARTDSDCVDVMTQIARGLLEAGDWVHRDLKPENVLRYLNRWALGDFGIAREADAATSSQTLRRALSPPYAAPEQWNEERASHATDVYALGCIGVELLTGAPPFAGPDNPDFARQHRLEAPQVTKGTAALRALLLRMLAKPQPSRPSIEEVLRQLDLTGRRDASRSGAGEALLANVAAIIDAETAQAEAAAAAALAEQQERTVLGENARITLREIRRELFARIQAIALRTQVIEQTSRHSEVQAALGAGKLTMTVGLFPYIPKDLHGSQWGVVCGDNIVISTPSYTRGASLWYVNTGTGTYRWVEMAYWSTGGNTHFQPCFLPPNEYAVEAVSQVDGVWHLAHPPRPIDDDKIDDFCQRWMGYLALAAKNELRFPGYLPEPA